MRGEPNWPAISYLSLDHHLMAAHWRRKCCPTECALAEPCHRDAGFLARVAANAASARYRSVLHLPQKLDPMGRVVGWSEIAARLDAAPAGATRRRAHRRCLQGGERLFLPSPGQTIYLHQCGTRRRRTNTIFWPAYRGGAPHRAPLDHGRNDNPLRVAAPRISTPLPSSNAWSSVFRASRFASTPFISARIVTAKRKSAGRHRPPL